MSEIAYIGLGSNLDNPQKHVLDAFEELSQTPNVQLSERSSLYQSVPMGPQDQGDFINAVAQVKTNLTPLGLLNVLQSIENKHGRIRKDEQWGPRTLDLDLLLFGNLQINVERLVVPHYGLKEREFVLLPLFEINRDIKLPDGNAIAELIDKTDLRGIKKL